MNFNGLHTEFVSSGGRLGVKMVEFLDQIIKEKHYIRSATSLMTTDDLLNEVVVKLMENDHQRLRHVMSAALMGQHGAGSTPPEVALKRMISKITSNCLYEDKRKSRDALHNLSERVIFALKKDPYFFKETRYSNRTWLVSPTFSQDEFPSESELEGSLRSIALECAHIPKLLFNSTRASPIYKGEEFEILCQTLVRSAPAIANSMIYQFLNYLLPDWGSRQVQEEEKKTKTTEGLDEMAQQIATNAVKDLDMTARAVISAYFSMENPNWVQVAAICQKNNISVDRKAAKQILDSFGKNLLDLVCDFPFDSQELVAASLVYLPGVLSQGPTS